MFKFKQTILMLGLFFSGAMCYAHGEVKTIAHELSHAFDSDRGLLDDRKEQGVSRTEWQAVQRENMIRSQLGHPLRTHYKIATDPQGKCVSGIGPRMLTDDNKPLSLPW